MVADHRKYWIYYDRKENKNVSSFVVQWYGRQNNGFVWSGHSGSEFEQYKRRYSVLFYLASEILDL